MKYIYMMVLIFSTITFESSIAQIKITTHPKVDKKIVQKEIAQKKLKEVIENVIKNVESAKKTSLSLMTDEEKKQLSKNNKTLKQLLVEDANDYLTSNGEVTSVELEIVFEQTRNKLNSMIEEKRMAKIISSLK